MNNTVNRKINRPRMVQETRKEPESILKSQASVEVLKVNTELKKSSICLIVGSLLIYGVGIAFPSAQLIVAGAGAVAGTYFFFKANQKEKYLVNKYGLTVNKEKFSQ